MRLIPRPGAFALLVVSLVPIATGTVACFSERSTSVPSTTGSCLTPASTAGATVVFIRAFLFVPPSVHVKAGESVAWVNCEPDATPHTATSDAAGWDSGLLQTPAAFVRVFPTAGTFPYHCTLHPGMKATVIVE
jgi:plastocyanin